MCWAFTYLGLLSPRYLHNNIFRFWGSNPFTLSTENHTNSLLTNIF